MSSSHPLLHIDLNALCANYRQLQQQLGGASCGAVVKANAYGLGSTPISAALYQAGCREFFVASLEEGAQLRASLKHDAAIYVLQGCEAGDELEFIRYSLSPVLISLPMAERYLAFAGRHTTAGRCVIKLNTGMNRLGLDPHEFDYLLAAPQRLRQSGLHMLLSHLACADEPDHPLNQQQLAAFHRSLAPARELLPGLRASLANSAGIFLGADFHFDLARPGAALYGINPGEGSNPMNTVASLHLQIMQLRSVQAGQAVGYGASYRAPIEQVLAIVSGGYADGLLRAFNNGAQGFAAGRHVPLVGRVSMDSLVFDVSGVAHKLRDGDRIEIMGRHTPLDDLAAIAGTIGYELFTRLGERCQRQYEGNSD